MEDFAMSNNNDDLTPEKQVELKVGDIMVERDYDAGVETIGRIIAITPAGQPIEMFGQVMETTTPVAHIQCIEQHELKEGDYQ